MAKAKTRRVRLIDDEWYVWHVVNDEPGSIRGYVVDLPVSLINRLNKLNVLASKVQREVRDYVDGARRKRKGARRV